MNNFEATQKRELLIMTLALAIPLLVLSLIFFNEEKIKEETILEPAKVDEYSFDVEITAKSAMITELNTGKILYSLNEKEERPIASITKLMTTLVATEKFEKNGVSLVRINENHLSAQGDSGLQVGQVWKIKDLIDFTLITSSNDGAKALALSAFDEKTDNFVSEMNTMSRKIGLKNTFFANETGLDISLDTEAGAISTAEDITKILKFITMNKLSIFESAAVTSKNIETEGIVYQAKNTNQSIGSIPGALLSKTGYTDLAGGNLVIIADFGLNTPVSIVVLGSTLAERERDIKKLYDETSRYYSASLMK